MASHLRGMPHMGLIKVPSKLAALPIESLLRWHEHAVTLADGAKESRNPRSSAASFGSTHRSEMGPPDSSQCFHGKVPVDMTNASGTVTSPGPQYWPSMAPVKSASAQPIFGTAKRVTKSQGIMHVR